MDELQAKLALAKGEYKTALKNLEMISDEIHERRRSSAMGPRGCGVGAEGSLAVEGLSVGKPEPDAVSGELAAQRDRWHHNSRPLIPGLSFPPTPTTKGTRGWGVCIWWVPALGGCMHPEARDPWFKTQASALLGSM